MERQKYDLGYVFHLNLEDLTWKDYVRGLHNGRYYYKVVNGTTIVLEDEYVQSYFISNTYFIMTLVAVYLAFVLKLGPKFMENRRPMNLKYTMILYNFIQVFINVLGLFVVFTTKDLTSYMYYSVCHHDPVETNPVRILFVHSLHTVMGIKILDLLDTIFMVLRKKNNHITFLHVYHHSIMVLNTWYNIKVVRDQTIFYLCTINTVVHIFMYSYYFICALGPRYAKIVFPYKNILTQMQLGQFVLILLFLSTLHLKGCEIEKSFMLLWFYNMIAFLILFTNFYIRNYIVKKDTVHTSKKEN